MIDTTRISSGFDIELQLGAGWFATAIQGLADLGELLGDDPPDPLTPDTEIQVVGVVIPPGNDDDLIVSVTADGVPMDLAVEVGYDSVTMEIVLTTDIDGLDVRVPFETVDDVEGDPMLRKVQGDGPAGVDPAIAVLINVALAAGPQSGAADFVIERGEEALAESFLPVGTSFAIGIGSETFSRFANDVWHTELPVAPDGSRPIEGTGGRWKVVKMAAQNERVRLTLLGEVPVDFWPDADVKLTIDIKPSLTDGTITFEVDADSDVDTGILGDILGGLGIGTLGGVGGLVAWLLGAAVSTIFVSAGIGFVVGVIIVEIVEYVIEGKIEAGIRAELQRAIVCEDDVVSEAMSPLGGAVGRITRALPTSIPIFNDQPDALHARTVAVGTTYTELQLDGSGLGAAGSSQLVELFSPLSATLIDKRLDRAGDLAALTYSSSLGTPVELELEEVHERIAEADVPLPLRPTANVPADATISMLGERLASVCLIPTNVRRQDQMVTDIRFSTGLELSVPQAVQHQDLGVLVLDGVQLVHPSDSAPYFRSPPNEETDDNFENLPPF